VRQALSGFEIETGEGMWERDQVVGWVREVNKPLETGVSMNRAPHFSVNLKHA
jgi:hypothetical protein